jgi:putative ABC transport system permease protein
MNSEEPSRLALRFLAWFCPPSLYESIEGDLMEQFEEDVKLVGEKKGKRRFVWNVIKFFRPGILFRNRFSFGLNQGYMIQNHFKTAYRHLMKSRTFSLINVMGLVVGITSSFLILQYLVFELSYDRFYLNNDRIFRVAYEKTQNGEVIKSSAATFFGIGNSLRDNFEEVEEVVRFYKWPANTGAVLMVDGKVFNERNYFFSESSFFKVFSPLLVHGDAESCLKKPNSIVLSQRLAKKIFGSNDPMGKLVKRLDLEDSWLTVTGIMRDLPANSHFDLDLVIPYDKDWLPDAKGTWNLPNNWTYILLKEHTDATQLEDRLNTATRKEQRDNPEFKGAKTLLQPLHQIHFSSFQEWEIKENASKQTIVGIGIAAFIILLIAWINYINLEISRFLTRIREVGVRRIIGSTRGQLVLQFFIQYICLVSVALFFSLFLVWWIRPLYHDLTGADFVSLSEALGWPMVIAGCIFFLGSIITGIYPAVFLARLSPIICIKGRVAAGGVSGIKKGLLTFQLGSSVVLLSFLFIVWHQSDFMRLSNKNMELEHVLTVYNSTSYSIHEDSLKKENSLAFRDKLLQHPGFQNVSVSSIVPGEPIGFTYHNLTKRSLTDPDDNVPYKVVFIDYYFIPVYKLRLKAGRNYSVDNGEDNNLNSLILNESAIRALGFASAEEAVDQEVNFMVTFDWKKYKIIGVVEDYKHESLKVPMHPTIFFLHRYVGQMTYYSILTNKQVDTKASLAIAEKTWKEVWPEKPFDYSFADERYDKQYKSEIYLTRLFLAFGSVAIFLACLGVLGMTLFEANSRLREVSIRKVLGARIAGLIALLSKDLFKVMLLAFCLAAPVVYVIATRWLSAYPIRIDLSVFFFTVPAGIVSLLVVTTSIINTWNAAGTNPIDHLKNE